MVRNIFKLVEAVDGISKALNGQLPTDGARSVLRYFLPFGRQHLHTHYQYFRPNRINPAASKIRLRGRLGTQELMKTNISQRQRGRRRDPVPRNWAPSNRLGEPRRLWKRPSPSLDSTGKEKKDPTAAVDEQAALCANDPITEAQADANVLNWVKQLRTDALNTYTKAEQDMRNHRERYYEMRALHARSKDPGLPNWSPDWTRDDFDREHLRHAMDLSARLREAQEALDSMVELCAQGGIEQLDWQDEQFPAGQPHYYTESQEKDLRNSARRARIEDWRFEIAEHDSLLEGQRPIMDNDHNLARYPGEHNVEWPSDVDMEIGRDVQVYDSASCVAEVNNPADYRGRRLRQIQQSPPPSWTWRGGHQRLEPDNSKVLMSHYF